MSYKFNPFTGNLDDVGTPIDTNQFALSAHAADHAAGGADELFDQDLNTDSDVEFRGIAVLDESEEGWRLSPSGLIHDYGFFIDTEGNSIGNNDPEQEIGFTNPLNFTTPKNAETTRDNLGLGTAATADSTDFAAAPIRGQCSKITSGTISGLVAGTYQTTALSATFDSDIASGTSLGTTDSFAIKNTSSATRIVRVYASMDATAGNNQLLGIKLAKNGTPINETECRSQTGSNNFAKLVTSWIVSLANNDEIALFVANINNTNNIAFQRGRIIVSSVD